jgi:hypothetical protein
MKQTAPADSTQEADTQQRANSVQETAIRGHQKGESRKKRVIATSR